MTTRLMIRERANDEIVASGCLDETVVICEGQWYFTSDEVNMTHLKITDRTYICAYKGVCYWIDFDTPDAYIPNIAWIYHTPKEGFEFIKDRIGFHPGDTIATTAVKEER